MSSIIAVATTSISGKKRYQYFIPKEIKPDNLSCQIYTSHHKFQERIPSKAIRFFQNGKKSDFILPLYLKTCLTKFKKKYYAEVFY